jgi:hypothetical protein
MARCFAAALLLTSALSVAFAQTPATKPDEKPASDATPSKILILNPRTRDLKEFEQLARAAKDAGFTHVVISELSERTDLQGADKDSPWCQWSTIMPAIFKHATPPGLEDAYPAAFVKRQMAFMEAKHDIAAILLALLARDGALAEPKRLRVEGADLFYGDAKIMLRGVAVGDPILAREGRPLSDYKVVAEAWNASVVRMGVHPAVWKHKDRKVVLNELARQVTAALDAGLFVIIEWHAIGWPDGYFQKPDPSWGSPADLYDSDFKLAKDFWQQISQRFGADSRIIFELWNEPVFQQDDYAPEVGQKWAQLKPFWQQLIAIIRAHSQNVILATSNRWAYNLAGIKADLLPDANVAYSWHVYAGHDENDAAKWAAALDDLQTVRPVIATEWGFQRDATAHFKGTPEDFGEKFVRDFLDAKRLHSTAWCWHPDWTPNLLEKDWKTPTEFGRFVRKYLKSHRAQRP